MILGARARFEGKVAVVTGGGSGIGRATSLLLAEQGAKVACADIDAMSAAETVATINDSGGSALAIAMDVANERSVQDSIAQIDASWGRIDIVVNNAAVFVLRGIEATVEEWNQILAVNVIGPALVCKHAVPILRRGGGGAIVNLGSISSFIAQPGFLTYNATKAAISNMTRCMALDLAPDHIRVNAVCPGGVWTPIVQKLSSEQGLDRAAADTDPRWGGAHILKRISDPREIAQAIAFLASDEASFITGENLMVDGGYTAI